MGTAPMNEGWITESQKFLTKIRWKGKGQNQETFASRKNPNGFLQLIKSSNSSAEVEGAKSGLEQVNESKSRY
jgi:hypothetical protein